MGTVKVRTSSLHLPHKRENLRHTQSLLETALLTVTAAACTFDVFPGSKHIGSLIGCANMNVPRNIRGRLANANIM